jgi:hypothetical protein
MASSKGNHGFRYLLTAIFEACVCLLSQGQVQSLVSSYYPSFPNTIETFRLIQYIATLVWIIILASLENYSIDSGWPETAMISKVAVSRGHAAYKIRIVLSFVARHRKTKEGEIIL